MTDRIFIGALLTFTFIYITLHVLLAYFGGYL
jgi:hypothetical protein